MTLLRVEGLTRHFGGLAAVSDVSFTIAPGEIVGLIGPNGAGKTTVFNLVTGFVSPTRGRVVFDGADITGLEPHAISRRGIVRTFQKTTVFPGISVLDNVATGCHRTLHHDLSTFGQTLFRTGAHHARERRVAARAAELLALVGLEHRRHELARNLPHGEQRVLELAIALAANPRLLLPDEPVAGLNQADSERVMELLTMIRGMGPSILLVEHNMSVVMGISDRVLVMDHGRKIAEGPPAEVSDNADVIEAYLGSAASAC